MSVSNYKAVSQISSEGYERSRSINLVDSLDKIIRAENINFIFDERHRVIITDASGSAFSPEQEWRIRQNFRDQILELLCSRCEQYNQSLKDILNIHLDTPAPDDRLSARLFYKPLNEGAPEEPEYRQPTLIDKLLPWRARAIETQNHILEHEYRRRQIEWQRRVDRHEQQYLKYWNNRFLSSDNIENFLYNVINKIVTIDNLDVRFSVDRCLNKIWVNARFPDITQLPGIEYKIVEKEFRLSCKSLSPTRKRQYYMQLVHAIGFRLIGEIYRAVPVSDVVFSGFCRRLNPVTAHIEEEYLYSVAVKRSEWQTINFSNLGALSLPDTMKTFDLRRNMTKTGIFRTIVPFSKDIDSASPAQQDIFISQDVVM